MAFDIRTKAVRDTFALPLNDASGEPLLDDGGARLGVTIYGPGSRAYAAAQTARAQRMMDRLAKRGGKSAKMSPEEQAREQAEFLAACTVSFDGWDYGGASDHGAVVQAYADTRIGFIAEQVSAAVGDWANFSPGSAKS